jgi:subtilase family serine protease
MRRAVLAAAAVGAIGAISAVGAAPALAATHNPTVVVQGASHLATRRAHVGAVRSGEQLEIQVSLKLRDAAGAAALAKAVSTPGSASYGHYLTAKEWEARFSPTAASVARVKSFLRSEGLKVTGVTADRTAVFATAGAGTAAHAFSTRLGVYRRFGRDLRLTNRAVRIPADLAGIVLGVSGLDQTPAVHAAKEPPIEFPEGFRNAPPCSNYFGELLDTTDPLYFSEPMSYAVCGYTPTQLESAYGLNADYEAGITGKGETVAIVDAYASPTLYSDARRYSELHEPSAVLGEGQFQEEVAPRFNEIEKCEASGWYGEQTLDVEAVHATAPGANILYVGARNCERGLFKALANVIDGERAHIITDSWGFTAGDLLAATEQRSYENLLEMATTMGIGVQFSSGDQGDTFTTDGLNAADYPASSPYVTAVGGTSLAVGADGERAGEWGWSTSKSYLCTETLAALHALGCTKAKLGRYLPAAPGKYDYGGGGGTSYQFKQPSYQEGVVPADLAERNKAVVKGPMRTVPDIAMDADPSTGMLVGETQAFPTGNEYGEYRIGGTSLASPLFAGVMALADQSAGKALGLANPLLYSLDKSTPGAFYDVTPPSSPLAVMRVDYLDGINAEYGELISARGINFEGPEVYCSGADTKCTRQRVQLTTGPGYDSMTGIGSPGAGFVAALSGAAH